MSTASGDNHPRPEHTRGIGRATLEPCLICGEPDPMLSYTFTDGRVIHLHGPCDALWQQERAAG
jgi:hypothetical protein